MAGKTEGFQDRGGKNRRSFLQAMAATAVGFKALSSGIDCFAKPASPGGTNPARPLDGFTPVAQFKDAFTSWKVYEDLRTRDGSIVFVSAGGHTRELTRSAEASMAEGDYYLGLKLKDIALEPADLLADQLLKDGDPDPEAVRSAAPPMASAEKNPRTWTTFVGTREAYDVTPVYRSGGTRTYHPIQYFPELRTALEKGQLYDGLVGGWMPAVRKIIPDAGKAYWEVILFAETAPGKNKFIVHTWHRTTRVEDNRIVKVVYGHSYPAYPPGRKDPQPVEFYRALLAFADYWDHQLREAATASLPQNAWVDLARHSFAKELMTRPEGLYPKYGAVDRDYAGSEYDGFQDIFTSAIYTNLEWGRLGTAGLYLDNYFTEYVDGKGMIDMRGPETAQYGLTLSLLARYFHYTRDRALLLKHRAKIEATARLLADMHEQSLGLPQEDPGYGLISGWSESDSCLSETPALFWRPYYANSAFAARGFKDLAAVWTELGMMSIADSWLRRSRLLQARTVESLEKNIQRDKTPPYIGLYPGTTLTFRESLAKEKPSPQAWPHRPYAELLQADILPPQLANLVIDCMRAHGATTLGVVANVGQIHDDGREILGFISYGYAQMLLRLDRIEEFLLFLYSHRYHAHTRGSWTAGEVTGITGESALYCMPAQQTIPLLVRWMLVLEDSDRDRLYLAKGVPSDWVTSGKEISIAQAPTRWGKVSFRLHTKSNQVAATVELAGEKLPQEVHLKIRLARARTLKNFTVNARAASVGGSHGDTIIFATRGRSNFEIRGELG